MNRAPAFPPLYPEPMPEELEASRASRLAAGPELVGPTIGGRPPTIGAVDIERLNPLTFTTGKTLDELVAEERGGSS